MNSYQLKQTARSRRNNTQNVTPQYVLHTLMHCTYYTVSLTCTVLYILYIVHTVHVPCFPVSDFEVSSSTSVQTMSDFICINILVPLA